MQSTVATLLLVTSTVILACVVIDYAVGIVQTTLNTENIPQLAKLRAIENGIQNQTYGIYNQTQPDLPSPTPPPNP